jgi:DNA-binding response OmpR family regulator
VDSLATILVVEDDEAVGRTLRGILEAEGYQAY